MSISRRTFLLATGGAATILWVPNRNMTHAAVGTSLLSLADMEISSFSEYESWPDRSLLRLRASGNSPTISSEIARAGGKAARVYVHRKNSSNSYRTEASVFDKTSDGHDISFYWQRTYWIGFSIFVPTDWRSDSSSGEVLFQIHDRPDDYANSKTPPVSIRTNANSDRWRLRVMYTTLPEADATTSDLVTVIDNRNHAVQRGKWTDWVFEYRPDWRLNSDGGTGVCRIWMNGNKVIDYLGPNAYNQTQGPYLKFGCYKSVWKDRDYADPVVERLYFFDEWRVSRPDQGSYQLVAPGGAFVPRPMPPEVGVT